VAVLREQVRPAGRRPTTACRQRSSSGENSLVLRWAKSFLFAGGSALLLFLARLFPHFWYFSLFALTPFLYRIITGSPQESPRLGFLLGLSFFGAYLGHSLVVAPFAHLPMLIAGTFLFSLFGWAVGWFRRRWGFSASAAALLWVGLETGLLRFGFAGGILAKSGLSDPLLQGLASLLGFLTVSALIVVLNSLLILAVLRTLEMVGRWREAVEKEERTWCTASGRSSPAETAYLVPEGRAPPGWGTTCHDRHRLLQSILLDRASHIKEIGRICASCTIKPKEESKCRHLAKEASVPGL
jgi:hypothetical protein